LSNTDPLVIELLQALVIQAQEANATLRALLYRASARRLSRDDLEVLRKLLPVVGGLFAGEEFSTWEVADCAAQGDVTGRNLALVLNGMDAHALGMLLRRAADSNADIDGVRIERVARGPDGASWRLV